MTTPAESEILPEASAAVLQYGSPASWRVPSTTVDTDAGTVDTTETPTAVKITPPTGVRQRFVEALAATGHVLGTAVETFLPSHVLTSSAIGFTPEVGHRFDWNGETWTALVVEAVPSGDHIAGWTIVGERT